MAILIGAKMRLRPCKRVHFEKNTTRSKSFQYKCISLFDITTILDEILVSVFGILSIFEKPHERYLSGYMST